MVAEHPPHGSFYRPCVVCGRLTNRVNYGHASGVIIDVCKDHGIWFDANELARILAWVRAGGGQPSIPAEDPTAKQADVMLKQARLQSQQSHRFLDFLIDFVSSVVR